MLAGSQARQCPTSDIAFTTGRTTMMGLRGGGSTRRTACSTICAADSTTVPQVVENMLTSSSPCPIGTGSRAKGPNRPQWCRCGAALGSQMAGIACNLITKPIYRARPLACTHSQRYKRNCSTTRTHSHHSPDPHVQTEQPIGRQYSTRTALSDRCNNGMRSKQNCKWSWCSAKTEG